MIQLTGAQKRFGPKILFENADWLVTPNERAGIVGANGTGKSTLLKVLAGIEGLDWASCRCRRASPSAICRRKGLSLSGRRVFAECMTVFAELAGAGGRAEATGSPACRNWIRRARNTPRWPTGSTARKPNFGRRDGYAMESQVGAVLSGLGFTAAGLAATHRGVLRRLADAHRAGQVAARKAQPAAARRAHQPSRSGGSQLAGTVPDILPVRVCAGFARPLLPGCHGAQDGGVVEQGRSTFTPAVTPATNS